MEILYCELYLKHIVIWINIYDYEKAFHNETMKQPSETNERSCEAHSERNMLSTFAFHSFTDRIDGC